MKKVLFVLFAVGLLASCGKGDDPKQTYEDQIEIQNAEEFTNQIQSVDGDKIKRPGSGGGGN